MGPPPRWWYPRGRCRRGGAGWGLPAWRCSSSRSSRSPSDDDPPEESLMNDAERFSRLRHDLANPLAAVLAEVQLLLLEADSFSPETVTALRAIEEGALRMRRILREVGTPAPAPGPRGGAVPPGPGPAVPFGSTQRLRSFSGRCHDDTAASGAESRTRTARGPCRAPPDPGARLRWDAGAARVLAGAGGAGRRAARAALPSRRPAPHRSAHPERSNHRIPGTVVRNASPAPARGARSLLARGRPAGVGAPPDPGAVVAGGGPSGARRLCPAHARGHG